MLGPLGIELVVIRFSHVDHVRPPTTGRATLHRPGWPPLPAPGAGDWRGRRPKPAGFRPAATEPVRQRLRLPVTARAASGRSGETVRPRAYVAITAAPLELWPGAGAKASAVLGMASAAMNSLNRLAS